MLTRSPGLLLASFTLIKNMETYQTTVCSVSLKFSTVAEAIYIYRDNQLISVNILIIYKRQENKTASGNSGPLPPPPAFLSTLRESVDPGWAFYFVKVQRQSTPRHLPTPATTHPFLLTEQILADMGGHSPDQSYTFFFTARSDASDLLSDVAWMIQTKTNALEFKNRS